jgi:hypothetical protein
MINDLVVRMQAMLEPLQAAGDPRQYFHATYLRITMAVVAELKRGGFTDPDWTERWDVAFANLYLDALAAATAGGQPTRPWAIAFGAPADQPALTHVLLGMNAHINFDLPQALVAVITDEDFDDPAVISRREDDPQAIDRVLAGRVAAEDDELISSRGQDPVLNRLLRPLSQRGSQRFLRESGKVWANAVELSQARRKGPGVACGGDADLEELSAARWRRCKSPAWCCCG